MALPHEMTFPAGPLTDEELADLERLSTEATGRPWQVVKEPLKVTKAGEEYGSKAGPGWVETSIHTAWDHGQLKGPAPVVTTASGPFYEPTRHIHIRAQDADFIVAACNATRRLLAEVRALRKQLKKNA